MENYNILWLDDEWETVSADYLKQKEKEIITNLSNMDIKLNIIEKTEINEEVTKIIIENEENIRLIILDIKLKNDTNIYTSLIPIAKQKNIPYLIYSSYIDEEVKEKAEKDTNCLGAIPKSENLWDILNPFFMHPSFSIIHLSDIHFNSEEEEQPILESLLNKMEEIKVHKKIDLVTITGDFAYSTNVTTDLREVKQFLLEISRRILMSKKGRLLIVPGNHDIVWEDYNKGIIDEKGWHPFVDLILSIYPEDVVPVSWLKQRSFSSNDMSWCISFESMKVSFIGISSIIDSAEGKERGKVTKGAIKYIDKNWKDKKDYTKILLLHHNIVPTISRSDEDEKLSILKLGDLLSVLQKTGCKFIISGHSHNSNFVKIRFIESCDLKFDLPYEVISISTGACNGVHPSGDRKRTFNVIDFIYAKEKMIRIIPYFYDSKKQEWIKGGDVLEEKY